MDILTERDIEELVEPLRGRTHAEPDDVDLCRHCGDIVGVGLNCGRMYWMHVRTGDVWCEQ